MMNVVISYFIVGFVLLIVGACGTRRVKATESYSVASIVLGSVLCVIAWPIIFTPFGGARK